MSTHRDTDMAPAHCPLVPCDETPTKTIPETANPDLDEWRVQCCDCGCFVSLTDCEITATSPTLCIDCLEDDRRSHERALAFEFYGK